MKNFGLNFVNFTSRKSNQKMIKGLFILATFFSYFVEAQFGVVQDKDGFVNVRELENANSQVLTKIKTGTILPIDPESINPNWILVEYKPEMNGYIYHDRIKNIEDFETISPSSISNNKIEFSTSDYKVLIETQKFNSKNHRIKKENDFIYEIDDKQALGIDGMMPTIEIKSFNILYKNQPIEFPKSYYTTLYNTQIDSFKLAYNQSLDQYYLYGTFSDGAASFDAVWVLQKGKIVQHLAQLSFYA